MKNIYVAGAWVEKKERAEYWIKRVRDAGFYVTHDWTVDDVPSSTITSDAQLAPEERLKRAEADIAGVRKADIVWLLAANDVGAAGSWVELGAALAFQQRSWDRVPVIIVSGRAWERTIFTSLADKGYVSDQDAFEHLVGAYG